MDFVSAWLKGIILIILFATFMDLLLPSSSMQKYVKLVIGLIIIITMLTPLLVIINGKEAFTGTDFFDWQRGDAIVASAIDEVSQRMTSNQEELTTQAVKQMVRHSVQGVINIQGDYSLVDVVMDTRGEPATDELEITKLEITLVKNAVSTSDQAQSGIIEELPTAIVTDVQLVQIDDIEISSGDSPEQVQDRQNIVESSQQVSELKQMLSKKLEISTNKIHVYIVEEG
ncbi:stage III sporulation protein AF [Desulfuribacillus alkaliarsenatis]|uniref:Stage III sporulation protein AF n=1 Tax=Desulfuribacillus alkaliarsenatis TaxID=766136 RepID=A0A1E5G6R1_9FIRM|nr:stage III sporulation protein AF [Desulfuribacillus alkaliarsenatis]OEF98434.1 stage III sporulation protein AF [Desulfuribacillus alkaliarsenatis]